MKKTNEVMVKPTDEVLLALRESFPIEQGFSRILLPRLGMWSQDQTEGKGKNLVVTAEAGTFYLEQPTEEENEEGKKVWEKKELGTEIEGTIIYKRKQLSYYDESTEAYTSSPIYDNDDDIIPLFCNKEQIHKGTPKELKAQYQFLDEDGKTKSKLKDTVVLYVLKDNELYQLNVHGSSMFSFLTYARKNLPPAVLTRFSSEAKEKGKINWNMMTFETVRNLSNDEALVVLDKVKEIQGSILAEKSYYASQDTEVVPAQANQDFGAFNSK